MWLLLVVVGLFIFIVYCGLWFADCLYVCFGVYVGLLLGFLLGWGGEFVF